MGRSVSHNNLIFGYRGELRALRHALRQKQREVAVRARAVRYYAAEGLEGRDRFIYVHWILPPILQAPGRARRG